MFTSFMKCHHKALTFLQDGLEEPIMTKADKEKRKREIQKAEEFARKALSVVSRKPVSEAKVRQVAKKIARVMKR